METEEQHEAPFLLVTALLNATDKRAFARALEALEIRVRGARPLFDWPRLSNALHPPAAPTQLLSARAYAKAWRTRSPNASLWTLRGAEDFARLLEHKRALRRRFPSQEVRVELPEGVVRVRLHSFHAPDRGCVGREWALVKALGLGPPEVGGG